MCKCPLPEPQVITPFTEWLCPDTSLPQPFVPGELITPDEPLPISERGGFGIASVTNEEIRDQRLDDQDNAPSQSPSEAEGRTKTTYATYYYHTDHLGGTSLVTDEGGNVVQVLDYYPYGGTRVDDQPGGYDSESKYTGQKLDAESGIYYYNARYYNQEIGRFTSIDPLFLALGAPEAKVITNKELQELLTDPQSLNGYAYSRNNPVRFIDEEGEFYGQFGRDLSSGQRRIASFLHGAADNAKAQGGIVGHSSAFVTHGLGDIADSVANVYDPDQKLGTRGLALGLVALEVGTGGGKSSSLKVGAKVGKLGKIVKPTSGKITGFFRKYAEKPYHGLDRIIERGVSPEILQDTVLAPLIKFQQSGGKMLYLSKQAGIVLDNTGKVVTAYSSKQFKPFIKNIINKIIK